jgi:uncharacterized damage-inducible protein DinB
MNNKQSIMITKQLIEEMEFEIISTRKLLQRIPEDKLTWKPHEKAMPLGVLAFHVANIPGNILSFADQGKSKVEDFLYYHIPNSKNEILESFPNSIAKAKQVLERATPAWYDTNWELLKEGKVIFTISRLLMCRLLVFNHWYHHRGQLVTYLRELEVPIPSVYGPSYDENPFDELQQISKTA